MQGSISANGVDLLCSCAGQQPVADRRKKRQLRQLQVATVAAQTQEAPQWLRRTPTSATSSVEEVKALLSAYLDKESVEKFFGVRE